MSADSSTRQIVGYGMPATAARAAGITLALTLLIVVGGRLWAPAFIGLGIIGLALVGYAAHRWPRATLVAACVSTVVDPVLFRLAMPPGMDLRPIGASDLILAVTGGVIVVNAVRTRTLLPALRDPVTLFVTLFVGVAVLSAVVNAVPPHVALLGIVMTVDAIAVYFVARTLRFGDRSAAAAIAAIVGTSVLVAVFGIGQVVLHPDLLGFATFSGRFGEGGRITSFVGNPNIVAMIVGLALPFPLFAAWRATERRTRWLSGIAAYLLLLALLLTFSRSAWLAVAVSVLLGALLLDRRVLLTFVLVVVAGIATTMVMPRYVLLSAEDLARYFPGGAGPPSLIDTTVDRIDVVSRQRDLRVRFVAEGLPIVRDHLWLGAGPGRYGGAAATITESPVYDEYGTGLYGYRTVHNFWLHLFGEVGVIGGAIFVTMIAGLYLRLSRAARAVRDGPDRRPVRFWILAGAATSVVTVTLHSATEMTFEGNLPAILVWLVIGVASILAPARGLLGETSA
jgi:putative inorganic carbon (hco3(-)) transporter